jgi:hypothetical protein
MEFLSARLQRRRNVLAWRVRRGKIVERRTPPFFAMSWFGAGVDLRGSYTQGRYIGESMIAGTGRVADGQATPPLGLQPRSAAPARSRGRWATSTPGSWLAGWRRPACASGSPRRCRSIMRADFAWGRRRQHVLALHREAF